MTYKLPKGWKEVKLRDVVIKANTGLDAIKRAPIIEHYTGIKCIRIQDISQKKLYENWGNTEVKNYDFNKFQLKKENILLARTGASVGVSIYINQDYDAVYNNGLIRIISNEDLVISKFIHYNLLSNHFKGYINGISGGTVAQPNIRIKDVLNFSIPLPPLEEQEAIANTLSALDDKIENNNKIAKNLEEQAQAIFKHWFVDFEFPKEEGKPYKSSGGEMVESELGMIPKGWEIKMIKDFSPVITGKKNANIASKNGKYRFFTCSQKYSFTDNYSFEGKAVLVAGNGDFNVKFYNGKFEAYQRTYVLIPYNKDFAAFIYYMVKHNLDKIIMNARGSVISYLTKSDIENSSIAIDLENNSINEILKFFNLINNKILYLQEENQKLEELRDTLLPKLISGELRIPLD